MVTRSAHNQSLPPALDSTNFEWLGERYQGKVRDSYKRGQERVLIATDRLSAFDRILCSVPGKGQILTAMAHYWFERTHAVARNHVVAMPDPCAMVVHDVEIIPIEVVVRGFVAGSAWRDYRDGRPVSGVILPTGLREFEQLPQPIVTPCTKAPIGEHDLPISELEIITRRLVDARVWDEVRATALALYLQGARELSERGLLFADTKYEFGLLHDQVVLADEIHTLDSSRFWLKESYEQRLREGQPPDMLDKEPVRRWLMERGFFGDGDIPPIDNEYRGTLMAHYRSSFERITGRPIVLDNSDPVSRLEANLRRYFGTLQSQSA